MKIYGEMIYQEQVMEIAKDIAGFTLQEADELRKSIGKKKPEIMAKVKIKFLEGTKKVNIVNEKEAEQIFEWIEKSQRYSFNKSHSVCYAYHAYMSAYAKAHFTKTFFTSYLKFAKEKSHPFKEIHELVQNARLMNIDVCNPDFRLLNKRFKLIDKKIYFGFLDMKGVGESVYKKIIKYIDIVNKQLNKKVDTWTWLEFLIYFSPNVTSTAITALINGGAITYMANMTRTKMVYEYKIYDKLTTKEKDWIKQYIPTQDISKLSLADIINIMITMPSGRNCACSSVKRKEVLKSISQSLENPPYNMEDSPVWLASIEESLLGIPLSCSGIESCDASAANCTCAEYVEGISPKIAILAVKINDFNEIKTKTGKTPGQKMAFLRVCDITGSIENVIMFPEIWSEGKNVVFNGNSVLLSGERSKDKTAFLVRNIWQI